MFLSFLCCLWATGAVADSEKMKVIILTGSNNHQWQETTPVLKNHLEQTGKFDVDVVLDPELLTEQTLAKYDLFLSNWNDWVGKNKNAPPAVPWSEELKEAYVAFVKDGGGHVVVHAGSASFFDWEDYQTISCATWEFGQTGHGPNHEFDVRKTVVAHPITQGMESFRTKDELWYRPKVEPSAQILTEAFSSKTGNWEPSALVNQFGKGRCFTLLLGHDAEFMQSPGFQALLVRGIEWAASGRVTLLPAKNHIQIQQSEESVSLLFNGETLWHLNHRKAEGKPYIHPLATTDGTVLTDLRPDDHPWHRALWFSWKYINGLNYWEEDRETGLSEGLTQLKRVKRSIASDDTVTIQSSLAYAPANDAGNPVMREERSVIISPPDSQGIYRLDWSSEFTALEKDVVLDRTPIPGEEGGKDWGGYAGYSVRMPKTVLGSSFFNSEGITGSEANRKAARWVAFNAPKGGGMLMLDHPTNLRYPGIWYIIEKMPYFSPAVIHDNPHTIKAGQSLALRYRLVVYPDAFDSVTAEREWSEWTD